MMAAQRLYRLEPLAEAAHVPLQQLGRLLGMSGRSWQLARDQGVGELAADRYAVRLGLHPATVWPELLDRAIDETLRECAVEGCTERFLPHDSQHAYCSQPCRNRAKMRRYRATKAGAAANRRHRKAYYYENRDYELAQMRRRAKKVAA